MRDRHLSKSRVEEFQLNERFSKIGVEQRLELLYEKYKSEDILVTSAFGTHSALLLYLISRIHPAQPIYFIDTGFHFPETLAYKSHLAASLGLQVIDVRPTPFIQEFAAREHLWESNPDHCCFLNKVMVLKDLKSRHKIWLTGLRRHQTNERVRMPFIDSDKRKNSIIKCCPLLDVDEEQTLFYQQLYQLPLHPLQNQGYCSIGCRHCTTKGQGRTGRWPERDKTECGLHN